jgi:alpha-glucan,water dikinase
MEKAWTTIKKVWASKFNERAFLATKKIGVSLHSVYMAVLVQRIIPA